MTTPVVMDFLEKAADFHASIAREMFWEDAADGIDDAGTSPLEQLFYLAVIARHTSSDEGVVVHASKGIRPFGDTFGPYSPVIHLYPQKAIGRYRADFLVQFEERDWRGQQVSAIKKSLVVELDGTAFHERSERERRDEKARDRFMQRKGYAVLRYTGKEVMQDPHAVADDVLRHIKDADDDDA